MTRRVLGPLALAAGSVLVTLIVLEAAFRLAHVPVGTVQINRATVRREARTPAFASSFAPGEWLGRRSSTG